MKNKSFVFFDVETTGLSPDNGDRIIELALLKVKDGKIAGRFESLINPRCFIPYGSFQINGISSEMLHDAPEMADVLDQVTGLIKDSYVVGHNLRFDLSFLNHELKLAGKPALEDLFTIDTVKMARGLLPEIGRYSLEAVGYFFGVEEAQIHRAMPDVELTYRIFCKLLEVAKRKDLYNVEILVNLFGLPKMKKFINDSKITAIQDTIAAERALNILYFSTNSGTTLRKITPKKIKGAGAKATVVGYCHLRNEERSFFIDRILTYEGV